MVCSNHRLHYNTQVGLCFTVYCSRTDNKITIRRTTTNFIIHQFSELIYFACHKFHCVIFLPYIYFLFVSCYFFILFLFFAILARYAIFDRNVLLHFFLKSTIGVCPLIMSVNKFSFDIKKVYYVFCFKIVSLINCFFS